MGCLNGGDAKDDGKKVAKKGAKAVAKTLEGLEWKEFKKLELDDIDSWFDSVAEVVNAIDALGGACDTANEGILQLCEAKEMVDDNVEEKSLKSVLKYFVKTTKTKNCEIKVIENEGKITIEVSGEGCGPGWLIFDGIKKLLDALNTFVEELPPFIPKIQTFVEESAEMPDRIKAAAENLGQPLKIPGIIKKGADNIKILGSVPNVMKAALEAVKNLLQTIKNILEGKDVEQ